MILILYNLALLAALVLGAPWGLWRMATTEKNREGLGAGFGRGGDLKDRERRGRVRNLKDRDGRALIWIHAVSVGEVLAVSRLVQALRQALPDSVVAVSTTTRTGQQLARELFGADRVFYCPLDLPWAVSSYLSALQPRMLVLAETEFWPNLLSGCFRRKIPVAVVNARVSDRSWPRYRRLRMLWRPFLGRLASVLAQTEMDASRLVAIGCDPKRVSVAGNLKFDLRAAEDTEATRTLKALRSDNRLVVAGSTLEGEEAALLAAWPQLLAAGSGLGPGLILVLPPRHPERFEAVAAMLDRSGFRWVKRSAWRGESKDAQEPLRHAPLVLLDSIGELASVYSLASVAFVGGSLVPAGGHNPLEPAEFGVPIVMGPYYQNFRAIVDDLRAHNAIRIAQPDNFSRVLVDLLTDREAALNLGQRARQVFAEQAGATERCVTALTALLSSQQTAQPAL